METNSKKILEALPDYQDILDTSEKIKLLSLRKMSVDSKIKETESANFVKVMGDAQYFVGGKPVAVSYYENAYKFSGIDGNLLPLREELASITAELDSLKTRFDIFKQMQDMYKTLVFAEKAVI